MHFLSQRSNLCFTTSFMGLMLTKPKWISSYEDDFYNHAVFIRNVGCPIMLTLGIIEDLIKTYNQIK